MIFHWLDIAFGLNNPFDYDSFVESARINKVAHAFERNDYLARIGVVKGKMLELTNNDHQECYRLAYNLQEQPASVYTAVSNKPCCGGGKVI